MYSRADYKYNFGQTITTDAEGVGVDRAFLAHYHIAAADAVAGSTTGVHAAMNLGAEEQSIETGITNPAVPRNIRIVSNAANATDKVVKIYGTNFANEEIDESITANGTSPKDGDLAFKTVTKIDLPTQKNTPAKQTETIKITNECTTGGDLAVTVTATTLLGAEPVSVTVTLTTDDHGTKAKVAAAVVAALNDDDDISAVFTATVTGDDDDTITLTANNYAANDSSLAIAFEPGDTGVTVGSSTDGTPGVAVDTISVGWGDKFGIPYKLYADELVILKLFNKAKEATEGAVTNDAAGLEKNVYAPHGDPNGEKDIDLYIIV